MASFTILGRFVSTHSRPKAAGWFNWRNGLYHYVSTHSRPKAAGKMMKAILTLCKFQHTAARRRLALLPSAKVVFMTFQHTAARRRLVGFRRSYRAFMTVFQHTAARRRLGVGFSWVAYDNVFQHTAARRRLDRFVIMNNWRKYVSTHSRPKAAGVSLDGTRDTDVVSTHSRPKAAGRTLCRPIP